MVHPYNCSSSRNLLYAASRNDSKHSRVPTKAKKDELKIVGGKHLKNKVLDNKPRYPDRDIGSKCDIVTK